MNKDKQKYWKRIFKGISLEQAKKELSSKFLEELKKYEKNKTVIIKELQFFLKRLTEGQSPKSALSGLSEEFKKWYFFITEPGSEEIDINLELTRSKDGNIGQCSYGFPRGNKNIHEIEECKYCKQWFCKKHLRPFRKVGDDLGHPCTEYDK